MQTSLHSASLPNLPTLSQSQPSVSSEKAKNRSSRRQSTSSAGSSNSTASTSTVIVSPRLDAAKPRVSFEDKRKRSHSVQLPSPKSASKSECPGNGAKPNKPRPRSTSICTSKSTATRKAQIIEPATEILAHAAASSEELAAFFEHQRISSDTIDRKPYVAAAIICLYGNIELMKAFIRDRNYNMTVKEMRYFKGLSLRIDSLPLVKYFYAQLRKARHSTTEDATPTVALAVLFGADTVLRYLVEVRGFALDPWGDFKPRNSAYFREIVESDPTINTSQVFRDATLLAMGVASGNAKVARFLVANGCILGPRERRRVLSIAISSQRMSMVRWLLDGQYYHLTQADKAYKATSRAAATGNIRMLAFLHDTYGCAVQTTPSVHGSPAFNNAAAAGHIPMMEYLQQKHGVDVHRHGRMACLAAIFMRQQHALRWFIEKGQCNLNHVSNHPTGPSLMELALVAFQNVPSFLPFLMSHADLRAAAS